MKTNNFDFEQSDNPDFYRFQKIKRKNKKAKPSTARGRDKYRNKKR